jgi:hypothetical protein
VTAFSSDQARGYDTSRFLHAVKGGADGSHLIVGLPFGSYYAVAVSELPSDGTDAWQEPAFLERVAGRASTVTMREGERSTVELRRVRP